MLIHILLHLRPEPAKKLLEVGSFWEMKSMKSYFSLRLWLLVGCVNSSGNPHIHAHLDSGLQLKKSMKLRRSTVG